MFDWIPRLETERLFLRQRTEDIAKRVIQEHSTAEQLVFFNTSDLLVLQEEKEKLAKGLTTWYLGFIVWDMIEKSTGNNIGFCGFHKWEYRHDRAEIGYAMIRESAKRKGYMSETVPRIIRYGFETMNLHRIEAFVHPSNVPSIKLIERSGFSYEGHKREDYKKDGINEDSLVYGLLKREYTSQS